MNKISIVIPALNEEDGIADTIKAIPKIELEKIGYEVQIIVVDNGSEDRTAELARYAGAEVVFEPRRGYGRAYKAGFAHAEGQIIATADADLTYPVEDIPSFVRLIEEEGLDFITTNRFANIDKNAMSPRNKLGNAVLTQAARMLFNIDLADSQSGMWVFKTSLLDKMILRSDGMPFSAEIKLEACHFIKCRWKELPIKYKARLGRVKLRAWRDGCENLFYLFRKRLSR